MICRAEPGTLMIFHAARGITAAISGKELDIVKTYLQSGYKNEFISRLGDLELLPANPSGFEIQNILQEIEKTKRVKAPKGSFAAPDSIHIDLTTRCPLNCAHCYKPPSPPTELSLERFSPIIAQAKDLGVFQIALGGGEPLLVKELPLYVKKVTSHGMACTITTSGYGLTSELLEELKESGIHHIQVSLNGSTKEIHSYSRDGFEQAIAALNRLSQSGVLFGINWVARMDNVHDFPQVVSYAKSLKADNINILRYKPSPREDYQQHTLTSEAFHSLVALIKEEKGLRIKIDSAFSPILCQIYGEQISPLHCGCGAGRRFMMIDAGGRFKPCSHMTLVSEGQDIQAYWTHSPDLANLRQGEERIDGDCQSCAYLQVCRGCRAICETIHHNIHAGEKNCPAFTEKELI